MAEANNISNSPEQIHQENSSETIPQQRRTVTSSNKNLGNIIFGFSIYFIIGLVFVWNNDSARNFVIHNRWLIIGILALLAIGLFALWVKQDLIAASAKKQIGTILFVIIPLLLVMVGTVFLLPASLQIIMLRIVFLLIACLLPAVMYYLFIASRKSSLLQEYFSKLAQLGLFERQKQTSFDDDMIIETEFERRMRVLSYMQKFEAAYGPLPGQIVLDILDTTDPENSAKSFHTDTSLQKYAAGVGGYFSPETAIPVVVASLLIGLGWVLTLPPWEIITLDMSSGETIKLSYVLLPQPIPVHFAFLGAYFFSMQMLFRRFVRKDLRANAYIAVTQRILLAVIGTWIVIQAAEVLNFTNQFGLQGQAGLIVVGFVIGAFPPVAWQVIQSAFRIITGARYFVPGLKTAMPVSDLDGLTVWHQARLEEEDIENVPNMASADIVELMLNTRFPAERIIDWVDQAILHTQLGEIKDTDKGKSASLHNNKTYLSLLREHGIRNASSFLIAYQKSELRDDLSQFESILPATGRSRIRSLADTLTNNSNLALVQRWRR